MRTGGAEVALMSVRVGGGEIWSAERPELLFEGPYFHVEQPGAVGEVRTYDVSRDGRFLMMKNFSTDDGGETSLPQIIVVQNWFEELRRLVPTN